MFSTICFRDDFSNFEGFLMLSMGSYTYGKWQQHQHSAWAPTTLTLGLQKKMIMLIQHTVKKENSSPKRYETSKWSFGDAIMVTDWKTFPATFHTELFRGRIHTQLATKNVNLTFLFHTHPVTLDTSSVAMKITSFIGTRKHWR